LTEDDAAETANDTDWDAHFTEIEPVDIIDKSRGGHAALRNFRLQQRPPLAAGSRCTSRHDFHVDLSGARPLPQL
jgi:hypothetical protein